MCVVYVSLYECVCLQSVLGLGRCLPHQCCKISWGKKKKKKNCLLMSLPLKKKKKIGTLPGSTVLSENNIQN